MRFKPELKVKVRKGEPKKHKQNGQNKEKK